MMFSFETGPAVSQTPEPVSGDSSAPKGSGQAIGKEDYLSILVLCALCLVLFFFRLGTGSLWDVDEGLHASTSKDMVLTGDWITTRANGINFYDKTVLFNWFAALSFVAFGFTEFAARLPAAILGLATVLVTYLLGRRLFGSRVGLLGGVILATSPEFIVLSRSVVHDISLAFFITLALFFFYTAFNSQRHRRLNLILFYAAAGLAVLAKGPIGLLLPVVIIGLFLLARGRLDFVKEMALGWGILVFLLVAAPWYVLISIRNPDYVSYFFLKQNLGNFLSKSQSRHPRPFYYYVPALLGGMLPWSFFLPLVLRRSFAGGLRKVDDGVLFLIIWFLTIFLFFSAASSKLETYILPSFPAIALLIGRVWHEMMMAPTLLLRRGLAQSLAPLPILFLAAILYIMLKHPVIKKMQLQYGINLYDLYSLWITITAILTIAFLLFIFRHYRTSFTALAATFSVGFLIVIVAYAPLMDPYRSTKSLAKEMDRILPPDEQLVFYGRLRDSALFYTNRRATILNTEQQLLDYLASKKMGLCVIARDQYRQFKRLAEASTVLREEGNKLLISSRPAQ